jgi:predicted transcriptional regulator
MALLAQNDVLFAHKALNIVPGLSAAARRVAGAIIDHFNKRTAQCDPAVERLARMLGIHEQTVKKATCELCEAGLINKVMHGGKMHRSKFEPQWARFQEIVADWDAAMKSGNPLGQGSKTATLEVIEGSETATSEGSEMATQTLRSNQSKEPLEGRVAESSGHKPQLTGDAARQKGAWKRGSPPRTQGEMLLSILGGKECSKTTAAVAGAGRRIDRSMHKLGSVVYEDYVVRATPEINQAAIDAEMKRKGDGALYVIRCLQSERMRAHG